MEYKLNEILFPYSEKNTEQKYFPVAVGKYGIRKREDIYKKELAKDFSKNKVIRKNTLTIGMGSTQIDIGILDTDDVYSVSPAYHTYKINTNIVIPKYLDWLLKCINPELSKLYMIASARQGKSVDFERMMKHKISIPSLEEQEKINKILSKIYEAKIKFYEVSQKYNDIVKSRFVELFGDPIDNPLNWKVADFKEVVYFQEGPGVRNWQFRDSGIKLINIRNLVDDSLVLENTNNYLSEQEVEEKYKHFLLDVGDYVMASSGVTWGKIAEIYEEHLPLCLNTSIIRLRPYDETVISKKYLFHYIKGDAFRMQIRKLITGSAQPNFGPTHLKKISIIVPPIELQNQFAAFVEQTDKSKYFGGAEYGIC